jgi:uncharacterized protein YuzE
MRIDYSPDVRALYVHLAGGEVAETVELDTEVMADLDAAGTLLGVEFLDAHDFFPFLARHAAADEEGTISFDFPDVFSAALERTRSMSAA